MGNQQTKTTTDETSQNDTETTINFLRLIDSVATKLILTSDFQDMMNLEDKTYCDKLVILTSDVIANRLTSKEISYLKQRTKEGTIVDEIKQDKIVYLKQTDLGRLDVQNSTQKQRICIGIAKFYVKIAHLFSAIVSTINPEYTYKDETGTIYKVPYLERMSIPKEARDTGSVQLNKLGMCNRRIQSILVEEMQNVDDNAINKYNIRTRVCNLNTSELRNEDGSVRITNKSLREEAGIPELKQLYMDVFDYNKGKFVGMSEASQKAYKNDLETFYKAFTGNDKMPDTIQNFSDIQLRDFHTKPACIKGYYKNSYTLDAKHRLLQMYAEKMTIMNLHIENAQKELLNVLDELFVYQVNRVTKNKEINIHPNLNEDKLDELIVKARQSIVQLYVGCETDFLGLLETFEAMVESQIRENTQRRIENIQELQEQTLAEL